MSPFMAIIVLAVLIGVVDGAEKSWIVEEDADLYPDERDRERTS